MYNLHLKNYFYILLILIINIAKAYVCNGKLHRFPLPLSLVQISNNPPSPYYYQRLSLTFNQSMPISDLPTYWYI